MKGMSSRRSWTHLGALALVVAVIQPTVICAAFGFRPGVEKRSLKAVAARGIRSTAVATAVLVSSSLVLGPSPVHASGDVLRGSEIFNANCASCHAGGQNVIKEKRTLKRDALEQFVGGYDTDTIQKFLRDSSRHQNQAYFRAPGGKLSELDFDDAAFYVSQTAAADGW